MQLITSIKLNFDCNYDNQRPWGCFRKKTCIYCLFSYFCDTEGCSVRVSEGTPPSTCNHVLCLMTNMNFNVEEIQESICTTKCVREEFLFLEDSLKCMLKTTWGQSSKLGKPLHTILQWPILKFWKLFKSLWRFVLM